MWSALAIWKKVLVCVAVILLLVMNGMQFGNRGGCDYSCYHSGSAVCQVPIEICMERAFG
jgi:hypothetical protein